MVKNKVNIMGAIIGFVISIVVVVLAWAGLGIGSIEETILFGNIVPSTIVSWIIIAAGVILGEKFIKL